MTREEITDLALSKIDGTRCMILELSTGVGKSKIAINLVNHICNRVFKDIESETTVLLLVAKVVHKQNWLNEINKWGGLHTDKLTIECYESLHKYKNMHFDVVILDEMQHMSEKRMDILQSMHIHECLLGLSATIKKPMKDYFKYKYNANIISCTINEAIESNILPEPIVYLIPMHLDTINKKYEITKFKKTYKVTQQGYYNDLTGLIEWYKNKYLNSRNIRIKNLWLSTAGKRLKWLSEQKETIVLCLLDQLKNYRTLTFCNNINQAELLGKYNITSKNKDSVLNLSMFNEGKIKHITAVNILNEGMNLTNCRIGIFCNLNSSELITKQRIGRLLRHKNPVIIIPYFKDTREEELVSKMLEEYNKDTIIEVNNIKNIKL
jgi:superfamily II DNA or RNA helicase